MSTCKSRKPELIAIYRLEFYKKQNNWKLSPARKDRGKKLSEKSAEKKTNLNVTYDLDHRDSTERSDQLNLAFVDSDSDKTTQTKCMTVYSDQRNKELSQEWLEPVNIWPNAIPWEDQAISATKEHDMHSLWDSQTISKDECVRKKPQRCTSRRLEQLQRAAKSQEFATNLSTDEDYCPEKLESKNTWINRNIDAEWKNETYHDVQMDAADLDSGQIPRDIWAHAPGDVPDGIDYANVMNPEEWDSHWMSERTCECSVDSEGEFVRGAHAAPHSSEAELAPPGLCAADVSFASLSRLSYSQLVVAARLHSRVLRKLLLESEQRQKLRSSASITSFSRCSFDEYPTKDIGPFDPGNEDHNVINRNIFYNDVFLAGSYKNVFAEGRGRGRGRLNETSYLR